jgi:hypothetical protein
MKKIIVATAIVASFSAQAEFMTGNKLLSFLNSSDKTEYAVGMGYVAGAWDALSSVAICAPAEVTVSQVVDMTKFLLDKNPSERHKSADLFVMTAGSEAWPCKKKSKSERNV